MSTPTTVRVELAERGYDILIGFSHLDTLGAFVGDRMPLDHAVVVTDRHVERIAERGEVSLSAAGARVDRLTMEPGEPSKSTAVAEELWRQLLQAGADRRTVIVAVGGGVVGDLAGFLAATYARGLPFVQVPTTLLAQVDSSVGGKVGVNLPGAKNMVGAFWQPRGVLIDLETLATLPDREYRAGLAEVVKYGVILDADFFVELEGHVPELQRRDAATLQRVVAQCCRLKARVVAGDETETTGLRAVLNYGHTFAHAIEAVAGYGQFLHGEAVSVGMICAAQLAVRLGRIGPELADRQMRLLQSLGLPTPCPSLDADQLLDAMARDKKSEQGQLRFVLPTRLGHVEVVGGIDRALVRELLVERT